MAVYVDDAKHPFKRYRRTMHMCHMAADTLDELHAMADKIGLNRRWFQVSNSGIPHYDICQTKRKLAVQNGAEEITSRELVLRASTA